MEAISEDTARDDILIYKKSLTEYLNSPKEDCCHVPPPSPEMKSNIVPIDISYELSKLGMYNAGVGTEALNNLTTGSYNFVIGQNSGINITTQNCNFIFGDDIPGEAKDHQFLIGDNLPNLTYAQVGIFMEWFPELYTKLTEEYPRIRDTQKIDMYTDEQLILMKEKLVELKNKYVHMF